MNLFMYKKVIEYSQIAYLSAEIIKDENNSCKDLLLKGTNKAFDQLFETKESDIKDKLAFSYIHKEKINKIIALINIAIEEGKAKDKLYIDVVNMNCELDIYSDGNEICIAIHKIEDVSKQLPYIFKNAPYVCWLKDEEGRYLDVNKSFLKEYKLMSYDDIIGKNDYQLNKKSLADKFVEEDKRVLENKTITISKDKRIICNGRERYFEVSKWPHIYNNIIIGVIGIMIEKTNEVELVNEMKRNQETFNLIANSIDDVIFIKDDEKYHYISPKFKKVYGVEPQELNLYSDHNNIYKFWDEITLKSGSEEFNEDGKFEALYKLKKDNIEKWLYTRSILLQKSGELPAIKVGTTSDITKLKNMEEQIENIRMEFFATLSHELRTPINLILSSLQVIDLKLQKETCQESSYLQKYLNIVKQNGFRLLKLVNNLIDTTKVDSGNFSHNPKNQDIISCVENICMSVAEFIECNNLNLIFDTDLEEKIIAFDQDNIERIILNLLSNAIKFSNSNGNIEVFIKCEKNVKIIVKDYGMGIPKDKLSSVFERFEQVKTKTKKEKEGSGIGLSLVKSLVEMHGGNISVDSKEGEGSTFIVTLPDIQIEEEMEVITNGNVSDVKFNNITNMSIEFSDIYI